MVISAAHFFSPARAQPTYSPGVVAGNSITYGSINVTWSSNGANATPPTFIQQLNQSKSLQLKITTVFAETVLANLTYTYKNGSTTVNLGSANVKDGSGDLSTLILAGGLSAGYPIYQTPAYPRPIIGETVTKQYAGALRSVNVLNENYTSPSQINQYTFSWDVQTGLLLEYSISSSYLPFETYTIHIKATTTNLWSPSSSPDFSFDAIPQSSDTIHQGESATFTLLLNSTNSFAGIIHLTPTLLNSTIAKPTLSLTQNDVSLSAGHSNSSILKFSTSASTSLGLYILTVNGTSSTRSRTISLAVTVSPPDFDISAAPANLTIQAGSTKSSVVTVRGLGSFSGAISLTLYAQSNLNVTLQHTTVNLSPSVKSANSTLTVQVPLGSVPNQYTGVQVTGTSGLISHSIFLPVNVTGPDFRMSANPFMVTLKQGATAQTTITLTSILGFQGTVYLSAFSYGLNVVIDKTQVFLNSTISPTVTLTITAPVSTQPGGYYSYVWGSSGILIHSAPVNVNVIGPDFSMTANPSFLTIQEGANATSTVTLTSILAFQGKVSLIVSNYIGGPTAVINPANVTLTANATATAKLTISTSGSVPGYYYLQITAQSGNLTRYSYVNVHVIGPDFTISSSLISPTLRQGGSISSTISLGRLENFNGTITLSTLVSGFGLTVSIGPTSVTLSSNVTSATATLTITAAQNAPAGSYYIQVVGTSGRLNHTAYLFVNVVAPDFQISTSPSNLVLQQGTNASSIITLTSLLGFRGTVTLTAYVFNSNGPTASFNATSLALAPNATATSKLTISTSSAVPGYYNIQVTATGGNLSRYGYISVQVLGPDFEVSISSSFLTLRRGTSVTPTVSLSRLQNFNGTVALASFVNFYPYPGGLTTSISPTNVTLSSTSSIATANLTLTAPEIAATGTYYVEVVATSGRLAHYAFTTVDVTVSPNFGVVATSPADFNSGAIGNSTITITPSNGFNGTVTIATSVSPGAGLTPGCPASLTVNGTAPVTATCHPTSTTLGTYLVKIIVTGGGLTRNATFVSDVGGFTISAGSPGDFNSGALGRIPILISSVDNFSGKVTLTGTSSFTALTVTCPTVAVTLSAEANVSQVCSLSSTTPGTYSVTIVVNGSPGTFSQSTSTVVHVGDFAISSSQGSFNAGATGASITVSLTSTFNFAGSVSINPVVDPSIGLDVVCPTSAIPLTPNATSIASCMLRSVSPATYRITLRGAGTLGTASHDAKSIVHVGDFAISVALTNINSGSDGSISVSLTSINNFAGAVSLSATASPSGLTVTCPLVPSMTANSSITASCSVTSVDPGIYSVAVTGIGSTSVSFHSASTVVHVGDFAISVGNPVNLDLGSPNSKISVNLTSTLDFAGTVVLTPGANPSTGLAITCPAVTLAANSSSLTYCTLNADTTGTFLVTIMGRSLPGTGSHSSSSLVQIEDFTISAGSISPSTITAGSSGTSSITIVPVNGYTGTVTLTVSPPSGITCSFDRTTIQSQGTSNLSCTGNTPGDYTVIVAAIGSSTFHKTSLTFPVGAAPAQVPSSPTMFGLQVVQFYSLLGGIVVAITVAGVTAVLRRKK